jgi:hypothetical protein
VNGRFWPIGEAARADYEALRAAARAGEQPGDELAAARFARRGLGALIAWPSAQPVYLGVVIGARRPAWSGDEDRARRRSARPTGSSPRTRPREPG